MIPIFFAVVYHSCLIFLSTSVYVGINSKKKKLQTLTPKAPKGPKEMQHKTSVTISANF